MWLRTVPSLRYSVAAISLLSRPSATRSTMAASRSVRSPHSSPAAAAAVGVEPPRMSASMRSSTSLPSTLWPAMTVRSAGAMVATSCLMR